ncbi:type II secretion system protein [Oscillibacter sp.]|uniref:type II secretion system protein n=1 Tax=Oscillibacter sp. TaxID=1945593 RepID=UPI0021727DE4|nr:prepilin-type N-terminal cleavage/methylation domain-containing protein [Oscillibacter sp.]MCI9240059.1 prepilin-type N-terminal cleavage/methylation domain-containing protein [Oscillibacter sp.]
MEKLKAKLKKRGGFTMVELLIVVAIIAILVAVSIPMMNQALERSRHAVDQANVRDALALAMVESVTDPKPITTTGQKYTYCVDKNSKGYLVKGDAGTTDTAVTPECECTSASAIKDSPLTVTVTAGATATDSPTFETSWHFDVNDDHTASGDANKAPTSP